MPLIQAVFLLAAEQGYRTVLQSIRTRHYYPRPVRRGWLCGCSWGAADGLPCVASRVWLQRLLLEKHAMRNSYSKQLKVAQRLLRVWATVIALSLVAFQGNCLAQGWTGAANDRYGSTTQPASPAPLGSQPTASPLGGSASPGQPSAMQPIGSAPLGTSSPGSTTPRSTASPSPLGSRSGSAAMVPTRGQSGGASVSVTKVSGNLPNQHGQVGRKYDIRPYTLRIANQEHPEQTIVDWILRETGYEAWHSEPFGYLSANRESLTVYHTPQMQSLVADILDRFINSAAATQAFSLRIATVRNPNWRAKALPLMTPIPVQSPGMQGWIMPKENAAILLSQLTKRSDWREHSASNQMVLNGHKVLLSTMRPRSYIKGVIRTDNTWPGFQPETGQLEEGATMEFSPLLSNDLKTADAVIKIRIHQVEKMAKVKLDIPTAVTGNQRMEVEVPQMTMANIHERFRWPADHVLVLSMGVVPPPTQTGGASLRSILPGGTNSPRADGLLMIDVHGTAIPSATPGAPGARTALQPGAFSGRY